MKRAALAAAVLLAGCITHAPRPVALPDGSQGLELSCGGAHRTYADCMNEAAAVCNGPYRIFTQDAETGAVVAVPVGRIALAAAARHRTMIVQCGNP